ncbi:helix-turn-helix domain-containing protein [Solirubrobacter sp. CPCC 204708]|uniref:Helix-turn-helix transcriptional regulator n=1 Tax=Solirubrobacter deserti TaxID=2282478 RepID=A0ABT4RKM5_9ACTN|nr:helix-turn-helix transcriptional regulator [Solirubrobacter deserti]MBE2315829.1 helix-turn-helix domain-containing protein [Solirubrobacter deserti]MDA0138835.1 helix-turn-helix transcriptional regulator [Solirubrobacter deserti]
MDDGNRLGEYLRARRQVVQPEVVGLPAGGRRRVPGLRREEVALLAGVSANYYLRLEQGRDRNPSPPVLDSLARVLQLDDTATAYLHRLARPQPRRRRPPSPEAVPPATLQLLETIGLPAFVAGRCLDVLAVNALVTALIPTVRVGENRLRSIFLDPADQALHPDWTRWTDDCVAALRDRFVDDPRAAELVDELSSASEAFRAAWARHDVRPPRSEPVRIDHPRVGELTLGVSKLEIDGADGLTLVVFHPEPGSQSAARLGRLAGARPPERARRRRTARSALRS